MSRKQLIFAIITTLGYSFFGSIFWISSRTTFLYPNLESTLTALIWAVFWLSLVCLNLIFIRHFLFRILVVSINSSILLAIWGVSEFSLMAAGLVSLSLFLLSINLSQRQKTYAASQASGLLPPFKLTLSLFLLSLSILYYPKSQADSQTLKINIPDQVFSYVIQSFGAGDPQTPAQSDFLQSQFENQTPLLRKQLLEQGISDQNLQDQQIEKSRQQFLTQAKSSLTRQALDTKAIKKLTESQLDSILSQYRPYLPFVLVISFYLTLSFFIVPVYILVLLLVQIYLRLLKLTGLATIQKEMIEVERLIIK